MKRLAKCFVLGMTASLAVAPQALAVEPDAPVKLVTRVDAIGFDLQQKLTETVREASVSKENQTDALAQYLAETSEPIWVDDKGLKANALAAIKLLQRADEYGLNPDDYDVPTPAVSAVRSVPTSEWLADAELKLNKAVLKYARDARMGRQQIHGTSKNYDSYADMPEVNEVMAKLAETEDPTSYLLGFHPQHPQFEALRQKLIEARGGPVREEKQIVVPKGPILKPGQQHENVAVLRERLKVALPERQGQPVFGAEIYDSALEQAVKSFQADKGLRPDGIVGPSTIRALNGKTKKPRNRTKQILANMERWRWLPHDLGDFHVKVNVPEYKVRVMKDGKSVLTERVVVGKLRYQTPVFSAPMDHIVFYPYWNVPNSIKREELLPGLQSGGGLFNFSGRPRILRMYDLHVKYNGRVINPSTVRWTRANITKYHFYQKPGGLNVLGNVKFMFPNKHDVYLHDTQEKFYFARDQRTYSHGCVRVQNPRRLAEALLAHDKGWSKAAVGRAYAKGHNNHVRLRNKIPVHITYFTIWVDDKGKLRSYADPYGHDARMARLLKS